MNKKKIIIKGKGRVLTSRGTCITPITRPYYEKLDYIMLMISKFRADVWEVLDDGREVRLTIQNFDKDNSKIENDAEMNKPFIVEDRDEIKARHDQEKAAAEAAKQETPVEVPAPAVDEVKEDHAEEPVNEDTPDEVSEPVQEVVPNATDATPAERPLSRKERKRLAAEKRAAEEAAKAEVETTEVPEEAIEE